MEQPKEFAGKAIVSYIDILGYSDLVAQNNNDEKTIQYLKEAMNVNGHFMKGLLEDFGIKTKLISDTIIVSCEQLGTEPISDKIDDVILIVSYILKMLFEPPNHLICRGGMDFELHSEDDIGEPGNLFIFSKAFINAYKIEQKAILPRIIVSDNIRDHLQSQEHSNATYVDFDGELCINTFYYYTLTEDSKGEVVDLLYMKRPIEEQLVLLQYDRRKLVKWAYFARRYNIVSKDILKEKAELIDLSVVDNQLLEHAIYGA